MIDYRGWKFPDKESHFFPWIEDFPNTTYQQESIEESFKHIKKFNCAIDIGANIGLHTVRFSQKFETVHSFEPTSFNFKCLEDNTKSCKNVILHNVGLGEVEDQVEISIPIDSNNYGLFSIVDFVDYKNELIKEKIKLFTLDSYSLSPDLIKIDTQGFEIPVIMGAKQTLINHKPVLILEIENKKEIEKYRQLMSTFGYNNYTKVSKDYIWWAE